MAKTKIFGEAIVVTSTIKLEDLKKVERYSCNSLILKGGEDGKQPIFGVCVAKEGMGNISSISASFAPTTRNADGYATVTMTIPDGVANAKEWMVDKFGGGYSCTHGTQYRHARSYGGNRRSAHSRWFCVRSKRRHRDGRNRRRSHLGFLR